MTRSAVFSLTDPLGHDCSEDLEGHVTAEDYGIVERLEIEACAEARARLLAQPHDLGMAYLVAACLAGPDQVTIDLAFRGDGVEPDVLGEITDRAVAAPAHRVHAGINNDPRGAIKKRLQQ